MRLVLDSNVWLDWLHFDDPAVTPLKLARSNDAVEIVIDQPCREELVRVLGYDRFGLDVAAQRSMLDELDRISIRLGNLSYAAADQLPRCADPDDVKFLALAQASGADWLITKDNALLTKRRTGRAIASYKTGTPQQWSLTELAAHN